MLNPTVSPIHVNYFAKALVHTYIHTFELRNMRVLAWQRKFIRSDQEDRFVLRGKVTLSSPITLTLSWLLTVRKMCRWKSISHKLPTRFCTFAMIARLQVCYTELLAHLKLMACKYRPPAPPPPPPQLAIYT